jgi:hypothetical protein
MVRDYFALLEFVEGYLINNFTFIISNSTLLYNKLSLPKNLQAMKFHFTIFLFATTLLLSAQSETKTAKDTSWKTGGVFDLKFSQVALSNWAGGGQNSISLNTTISLFANYKKEKNTWTNTLDLAYGLFNQAKSPYWAKNDDRIELNSKFGRYAARDFDYTAFISFRTQFAPGFKDPLVMDNLKITISDFFAPAYLQFGLGMDYKPNERFNVLMAPVSGKITMVHNQTLADAGAFGVEFQKDAAGIPIPGSGKRSRTEFGGTLKFLYNVKLHENVSLKTRVDLFTNYLNNPQNIDVNAEVLILMKVTKFISASISALVIYDDDVNVTREIDEIDPLTGLNKTKTGPITQFKEIFGIGFNYKF